MSLAGISKMSPTALHLSVEPERPVTTPIIMDSECSVVSILQLVAVFAIIGLSVWIAFR
jgi:hypothetical protein